MNTTRNASVKPSDISLLAKVGGAILCAIFILGAWSSDAGAAKEYPLKPITIIVPWNAGSATDLIPRAIAPKLSKVLGVPVNIINKPGGSGITGTRETVTSKPDGYTLLADGPGTSSIHAAWGEDLPYKVFDRKFIARIALVPEILAVRGDAPWKNMEDLVKAIKENPSGFKFSDLGGLGAPDVLLAQFKAGLIKRGVNLAGSKTVTFTGSATNITALGGGHVDLAFAAEPTVIPMASAGKIRLIIITTEKRSKNFPDLPTAAEEKFPEVNLTYWVGLGGPGTLPAGIVKTLENAMKEVTGDPAVVADLAKLGGLPGFIAGEEYRKFVQKEADQIREAGKASGRLPAK
jgi:tripartite-type tricarboxylate transporter receptor subunit TctC